MPKIILTSDGSNTIYVPELDEHYHSTYGAINESRHIFIDHGYKASPANPVSIFEMGFGTGLNALLTLYESLKDKRKVEYVCVEKYPLAEDIYSRLNYDSFFMESESGYFCMLHKCEWARLCEITENFSLLKFESGFSELLIDKKFDIVYYDAFAPGKQPGMWSFDLLSKAASLLKTGGIFVTYSAAGQLRRDLHSLGFTVEHPDGPRGKRHITLAVKKN